MWARRYAHSHPESSSGAGEGGGYLASTADLMIGLLFIFIILVVILAIKSQDTGTPPPDPRRVLTQELGKGLTGKFPGIRIDPETGVISLPEEVLFPSGSAVLTADGQRFLQDAANVLTKGLECYVESQRRKRDCRTNPENHQVETIFIEGHTDSVPFAAGPRDNFDLSLQRARAVETVLVSDALKAYRNKADQPLFSLSAYADTRPIKGSNPAEARNRRVDLRLVLHYQAVKDMTRSSRMTVQDRPSPKK